MNSLWGTRDTCTSCGSVEVAHVSFGFPADPESAPAWVEFGGCVIDGNQHDRRCATCGHSWASSPSHHEEEDEPLPLPPKPLRRIPGRPPRRRPQPAPRAKAGVRLLSPDGASFALIRVPTTEPQGNTLLVDIELLTTDRLVRYLARPITRTFIEQLADAWIQAAAEPMPEQAVSTVQDTEAGLAVQFVESTEFGLTIDVLVVTTSDSGVAEPDQVAFDLPRASLIPAAHELKEWMS